MWALSARMRAALSAADPIISGFNFGSNDGESAGQTVTHAHSTSSRDGKATPRTRAAACVASFRVDRTIDPGHRPDLFAAFVPMIFINHESLNGYHQSSGRGSMELRGAHRWGNAILVG